MVPDAISVAYEEHIYKGVLNFQWFLTLSTHCKTSKKRFLLASSIISLCLKGKGDLEFIFAAGKRKAEVQFPLSPNISPINTYKMSKNNDVARYNRI